MKIGEWLNGILVVVGAVVPVAEQELNLLSSSEIAIFRYVASVFFFMIFFMIWCTSL